MQFRNSLLRFVFLAVALLFAAAFSTQAQDHAPRTPKSKNSSVRLGNVIIVIPDPEGFEEATSQFETIKTRMSATEEPTLDMLFVHMPVSDCELLRNSSNPAYNHYTKVSVLRAARDLNVSSALMAGAVDDFRKNAGTFLDPNGAYMKNLDKHVEQGLSRVNSNDTKIEFNKPQQLGEFDSRPDVNSFLMIMSFKVNSGGVEGVVTKLISTSFVRIKERLIYVYVYMKYRSAADMDTIKEFTRKWTTSILAANRQ